MLKKCKTGTEHYHYTILNDLLTNIINESFNFVIMNVTVEMAGIDSNGCILLNMTKEENDLIQFCSSM